MGGAEVGYTLPRFQLLSSQRPPLPLTMCLAVSHSCTIHTQPEHTAHSWNLIIYPTFSTHQLSLGPIHTLWFWIVDRIAAVDDKTHHARLVTQNGAGASFGRQLGEMCFATIAARFCRTKIVANLHHVWGAIRNKWHPNTRGVFATIEGNFKSLAKSSQLSLWFKIPKCEWGPIVSVFLLIPLLPMWPRRVKRLDTKMYLYVVVSLYFKHLNSSNLKKVGGSEKSLWGV